MPVLDKIANIGEGRKLKNLTDLAKLVNTYEPEVEDLSDDELREGTVVFKERVANGEALDDLLPEAFASVREAARRTIGQRHFDVHTPGILVYGGPVTQERLAEGKPIDIEFLTNRLAEYLDRFV